MFKVGKLSKVELYYIEGNLDLTAEEISRELNRSPELIQKKMDEFKKTEKKETKTQTKAKDDDKTPHMLKMMGRHKRGDEHVATIMTKNASEYADATRSKRLANKKIQDAIHKPYGEE